MLETLYLDGDFPLKKVNDLALILPIKNSIKIRFLSKIQRQSSFCIPSIFGRKYNAGWISYLEQEETF